MSIKLILDAIITGLIMGGIYSLIAMGLNLQYGVARVLNVSHGEFVMVGAFITFWAYKLLGINPLISLAICGPTLFIIGLFVYRTLFKYLRKSSQSMDVFEGRSMLASFGILYIIQNIALLWWGPNVKAYTFLNYPVQLFGLTLEANRLVALLFTLGVVLVFYMFIQHSNIGKAIRAASQNEASAQLLGINVHRVLALCFGLGALLAGLAGSIISMMQEITPLMGFPYLIIALIVLVLGGAGNILGSLVGGLILGGVTTVVMYWEPGLTLVVSYAIFALILIIRPQGVLAR
ncbi:MAG: branched-chain amino acid ABC transporter permease [Deltaproteobacteria bacterium]|jgi:branched-chain amino acid transport system permease protein